MATKIEAQDLEISGLKARIKLLEDKDKGSTELSEDDTPIKGRSMKIEEEAGVEKSIERGSNDTKELVNVLTSMEAANILTSGVQAVSFPLVAGISTVGVPTVSEEELKMMIDGLDRNNEVIVRHLQEYEQSEEELTIGEKIDLINELEQREFYMSVLRSHAGWKTKNFRGMTLEEIREKFIFVWKKFEDFVPMASKEEGERVKRKGLKLEQGSTKKIKTSKEEIHSKGKKDYWKIIKLGGHITVYQFFVDMLKQLDKEDLNQLWALVKETLSIRQASRDKENELWVELKRLFEPDFEDQLWTHTQALMHDPL
nr:hypothetical protein [Tanacetum cinerariifolium]